MFNPITAIAEFYALGNTSITVTINGDGRSLIFEGWSFGTISYNVYDNGLFEVYIEDIDFTQRFATLREAVEAMDLFDRIRSMDYNTMTEDYCDLDLWERRWIAYH